MKAPYGAVHLVGVGGAGMAALALALNDMGCRVSGSDRADSPLLADLRSRGVRAEAGHRAEAVDGVDLVAYSAAIPDGNVELARARAQGIETLKRAVLVGRLASQKVAVGIAGCHGKTTCASMLARVLEEAGLDPAVLVGGQRHGRALGRWTNGEHLVVEADEYDRSFLQLRPQAALVTNVEPDHLECYGDLEAIHAAFVQFLEGGDGPRLTCGDDAGARRLAVAVPGCLTYGFDDSVGAGGCDYRAAEAVCGPVGGRMRVIGPGGNDLGPVEIGVPGRHNLLNALGVVALAHCLGVDPRIASRALAGFDGVERRLQLLADCDGVLVVDDYAHHPTEIAAALEALAPGGRRLVAVFQPHLYSRTRDLLEGFAEALQGAQRVWVMPVYAARETPASGCGSEVLVERLWQRGFAAASAVDGPDQMLEALRAETREGDTVVFMGAGDIDLCAARFAAALRADMPGGAGAERN